MDSTNIGLLIGIIISVIWVLGEIYIFANKKKGYIYTDHWIRVDVYEECFGICRVEYPNGEGCFLPNYVEKEKIRLAGENK